MFNALAMPFSLRATWHQKVAFTPRGSALTEIPSGILLAAVHDFLALQSQYHGIIEAQPQVDFFRLDLVRMS